MALWGRLCLLPSPGLQVFKLFIAPWVLGLVGLVCKYSGWAQVWLELIEFILHYSLFKRQGFFLLMISLLCFHAVVFLLFP